MCVHVLDLARARIGSSKITSKMKVAHLDVHEKKMSIKTGKSVAN